MQQEKIDRINFLAKKDRESGLTDAEKEERLALRQEYIESFRRNLTATLDNTYIVTPDGAKTKLEKK